MNKFKTPFVMLLSGVPMSGKSTWIKENYPGVMVISRDDILLKVAGHNDYNKAFYETDGKLVDKKLSERFILANSLRENVIVDMTQLSVKSRRKNLAYFSDDFYKVSVVFPVLTSDEYNIRNDFRKVNENKSIPDKLLSSMIESFVIPSEKEGFDEVIFI